MRLISLDRQLKELRDLQAKAGRGYTRELIDAFIEVAQRQEIIIDTDNLHDFKADAERLPAADLGKTMTWMYETLMASIRERDALREELEAAKRDLTDFVQGRVEDCDLCRHAVRPASGICDDHGCDCLICRDYGVECVCASCRNNDKFEWRGAQHE